MKKFNKDNLKKLVNSSLSDDDFDEFDNSYKEHIVLDRKQKNIGKARHGFKEDYEN
jgi:hypothetical protein